MIKLFLSAAVLFALSTATQAQFSTGNLLNKAKDKAKQKAEEKTKQEAEKAFTKNNHKENKKEDKNKPIDNTSTTQTMTEEQTETAPAKDYTNMNKEAYIQALNLKSNRAMSIDRLQGSGQIDIDEYYDRVVIIDLANFYPVMVKKGKPTGYEGLNEYDRLIEVHKTYPATYEANFKPLINGTIDGAYQLMKTNRADAVANLKLAMKMNDACLLVIPDLKSALEMRTELEGALANIGGAQSKVYTSEFHKKNAGKILFSKEPVIPGKETPAQFTNSFGPTDYIYGIVYLNATIGEVNNLREDDHTIPGEYRMSLDGSIQPLFPKTFNHNKEDRNKSYFLIEIRPDPTKAMHGIDATYFADRFADFSPRKHTVKIGFASYQAGDPFAEGEFKIDWTDGDAARMKADAKEAVTRAQNNYAKTVHLDDYFYKPNYVFQDPSLSVANLKKAFLAGTPDAVQVLKLITVREDKSEDWSLNRNDYGVIINKTTNHYTGFVYKAKDGNCYIHEIAQFLKAATGGGGYGNLVLNPNGMIDKRIACENVK